MNPETPGLEDLIGKEVYYSNTPLYCLDYAKHNCKTGILKEIRKGSNLPFWVDKRNGYIVGYGCILTKKEEPKPKYVPFESQEEFLNYYAYHRDKLVESSLNHQLSSFGGVWLKGKKPKVLYMVIEIWDEGVVLGDTKTKATNQWCGEYVKANTATEWKELCENYTFLDGSPCGKLREESDA
ncbi:MAG: hypothetical protein ACI4TD_09045 [Phocaeicola sp.]